MYNGEDYKCFVGDKIEGISSFSFEIPELADWLKFQSVELRASENGQMIIQENKITPIVLKKNNPQIYIKYEMDYPSLLENGRTEMTLRNVPRVFVEYETKVDDSIVISDLGIIMRFFALLIGRISYSNDIRLQLKEDSYRMWLYINREFSYNSDSSAYRIRNRTNFQKIKGSIEDYFEHWYSFSEDDKFSFLQNAYFNCNGKKNKSIDDIFLTYCKFLEGYDLRITKDEERASALNQELVNLLKDEQIKSILSPVFKKAGSTYKPKDISKWISTGFLERVSLKDRIKRLDDQFLKIIQANSHDVINMEDANDFYLAIARTRNYYSHFKQDSVGILSYAEMYRTLDILESLIVVILLNEMGMQIEEIKSIMVQDDRYWHILSHHRANE